MLWLKAQEQWQPLNLGYYVMLLLTDVFGLCIWRFLSAFVRMCHHTELPTSWSVEFNTLIGCLRRSFHSSVIFFCHLYCSGEPTRVKETIRGLYKCFGPASAACIPQPCIISRPLSGLPLILSLVVFASEIVSFYTFPCLNSASMRWPPPICSSCLESLSSYPDTSDCITPRNTRRPVGNGRGFDQNYFFQKQSNWLKSFICFTDH